MRGFWMGQVSKVSHRFSNEWLQMLSANLLGTFLYSFSFSLVNKENVSAAAILRPLRLTSDDFTKLPRALWTVR